MKNTESIMAAFYNCYLVEENNLFTKTLYGYLFIKTRADELGKKSIAPAPAF